MNTLTTNRGVSSEHKTSLLRHSKLLVATLSDTQSNICFHGSLWSPTEHSGRCFYNKLILKVLNAVKGLESLLTQGFPSSGKIEAVIMCHEKIKQKTEYIKFLNYLKCSKTLVY